MNISDDERISYSVGSMCFGAYRAAHRRTHWFVYAMELRGFSITAHLRAVKPMVVNDFGELVEVSA